MFMLLLQVFYVLPILFQCIHLILSPLFCQDVLFQILQSSDQVKCEQLTRRYNLEFQFIGCSDQICQPKEYLDWFLVFAVQFDNGGTVCIFNVKVFKLWR